MGHPIAAWAAGVAGLLALLGCAPEPAPLAQRNPYHECRQGGASAGSEAFERCIDRTIALRCAGTADQERCTRRLRDTVLVTDTLERQGYRVGFDQLRLN